MFEEVLPPGVVREIVASPKRAVCSVMSFKEAVVFGNAGIVETSPENIVVLHIARNIDLQESLQGAVGRRQLQEIVIQRRS